MLDEDQLRDLIEAMWKLHTTERLELDDIYGYVTGERGVPKIPEDAESEVVELARLSVKNVLGVIRDSFVQNLCVVGFRNALARENSPAWAMWQRNRMDARQAEIHRPAVTYGASYMIVTKGAGGSVWRAKSPRQMLATYTDPQVDLWPQYACEWWVDETNAKPRWRAALYDQTWVYPLTLDLSDAPLVYDHEYLSYATLKSGVADFGEPYRHGAAQCPVVRFINARDADDMIVGEVEPLITMQRTLNAVNFDRLLVSRFGAYPQKVIAGWSGTANEVLRASARRVWAFDDSDVRVDSFPPADLGGYNDVLSEIMEHMAMAAQISPAQVTGKLVNLSAEALAASEANQQRKLAAKRDSFGESWEQVFRLAAEIDGDTATMADTSAEVQWRDTEARSFAAIVDGLVKLIQAGIPAEPLLEFIPGLSQQQIQAIKDGMRRNQITDLVAALRPNPPAPNSSPVRNGSAVTG